MSINHPSNGPNNAPPNLPKDATPETKVLDQLNSSSIALNIMLDAKKVGPLLTNPFTPPAIEIIHPKLFFSFFYFMT